jgi:hypothetical protein
MTKFDRATIEAIINGDEVIDFYNYMIRVTGEHVHVCSKVNTFETSFTSRVLAACWLSRLIKAS